jgi:hypothetical protein
LALAPAAGFFRFVNRSLQQARAPQKAVYPRGLRWLRCFQGAQRQGFYNVPVEGVAAPPVIRIDPGNKIAPGFLKVARTCVVTGEVALPEKTARTVAAGLNSSARKLEFEFSLRVYIGS